MNKIFGFTMSVIMMVTFSNSTIVMSAPISNSYAISQVAANAEVSTLDKVRYIDTIFTDVNVVRDIQYGEAINNNNYGSPNEKLLLDVYSPVGDNQAERPVMIYVHGGGLSSGSKNLDNSQIIAISEFAKKGYVVVSIDYRLTRDPDNTWNSAMENAMKDVVSSIQWIKTNSKQYEIDKNNIVLAGYSAGAEIITNLVYGKYVDGWDRTGISAVVDVAGNRLFWGSALENSPPCVIIHGTNDDINPISASQQLVEQLKYSNIECELISFYGSNHFFSNLYGNYSRVNDAISKFLYTKVSKPAQFKKGDVDGNGKVNCIDYVLVKRFLSKLSNEFPSTYGMLAADVDNDGVVTLEDNALIKKYLLKFITGFVN